MTSANHDRANTSWRRIADQSIWGPRGPVKTIHLWLPLAVVFIDTATEELKPAALLSLRLLLAAVCFVLVTILTNDLCDRREDASSAKERWIVSMPRPAGLAIVGVMACLGLLVLLPISGNAGGAVAYIAALGLGTLYSVRPVRLKGRGAWGPLTYGLSTALAFAAMPWASLQGSLVVLSVLLPAVLLDKWVNLHFHQILDLDADRRAGVRTLAVRAGPESAHRSLLLASRIASLALLCVPLHLLLLDRYWGTMAGVTCVGVLFAVGIYVHRMRSPAASPTSLLEELPWYYLALTYGVFRVLPLVLLAGLALQEDLLWPLFMICLLTMLLESHHSVRYRYR